MTPYERAVSAHEADPDNDPFADVLAAHLVGGVVVSTPDVFFLARPVDTRGEQDLFDYAWCQFADPDCWHCYLAAGDLRGLGRYMPYPLPFISFVRRKELRIRPLKKVIHRYGWQKETREGSATGE